MREIKFRAWNGKTKTMYNVDVLAITKCTWDCPDFGKRGVSLYAQPSIKVMQYTGIDDKYGKEIYEGDILTTDRYICIDEGKQNYVLIVEYDECSYYVVAHCVNKNKAGISNGMSDILDSDENYTVLGNIYENPELLNYRY